MLAPGYTASESLSQCVGVEVGVGIEAHCPLQGGNTEGRHWVGPDTAARSFGAGAAWPTAEVSRIVLGV